MREQDGRAERVLRQSRALGEDARGLAKELSEAAKEVRARMDLSTSVQAHPLGALVAAAGLGYLLGGGLFSPLTGRLLGFGARALVVPVLKAQLEAMVVGQGRST